MKKVLTVTIASLVTLLSFAADNPKDGRLRISNMSRQDVFVVVDGRMLNGRDDHMLVGGLRPGYHNVKVYRRDNRGHRRGGIFGLGRGHTLLFDNSVFITPQAEVRVIIDRRGQVHVDRNRDRGRRYGGRDRDYGRRDRDSDWRR